MLDKNCYSVAVFVPLSRRPQVLDIVYIKKFMVLHESLFYSEGIMSAVG